MVSAHRRPLRRRLGEQAVDLCVPTVWDDENSGGRRHPESRRHASRSRSGSGSGSGSLAGFRRSFASLILAVFRFSEVRLQKVPARASTHSDSGWPRLPRQDTIQRRVTQATDLRNGSDRQTRAAGLTGTAGQPPRTGLQRGWSGHGDAARLASSARDGRTVFSAPAAPPSLRKSCSNDRFAA